MRIVVVGSVAAGTSVGAKARRKTEDAQIVVYERDRDISYSGCGLPYYVGGEVDQIDSLTPRDPAWFAARYNIDIRVGHDVTGVDPRTRCITVVERATGATFTDTYDELVLATGVSSVIPPVPGVRNAGVFTLRSPQDARAIRTWIDTTAGLTRSYRLIKTCSSESKRARRSSGRAVGVGCAGAAVAVGPAGCTGAACGAMVATAACVGAAGWAASPALLRSARRCSS